MSHQEQSKTTSGLQMLHRPDPIAILHAAVEHSPLGIKGAARAIGRSPGILYNKFSESMPHYDVTAREAIALCRAIGDHGYVDAVCAEFGGMFLPLPEGPAAEDDVLAASLEMIRQMGDLARELTEARADGLIDEHEFSAMELRGQRMIRAVHTLLQELKSQVQPSTATNVVTVKP